MRREEKYKQTLEKARKELQELKNKDCDDTTRRTAINVIYNLFPELKEPEDEKIRRALIENFIFFGGDHLETSKWGKDDNVFFTSDTHFSHVNIIKYCKRPFTDIEEHDETLISNWNNVVGKEDTVFHLGDVALGPTKRVHDILERLNGKIYLCIGNHDWRSIVKQQAWRFEEIHQQYNLRIGKRHVILNHFPFLCYSGSWRGLDASYQLFGHVHTSPYTDKGLDYSRLDVLFPTQYDVGVDNNNFTPISWNDVNNIISAQIPSSK